MAPRGNKRAATASPVGRATKHAKSNPVEDKCNVISAALATAALPAVTVEMLAGMVPTSLGVFKDQRHHHQSDVVVMLSETLSGIEAGMQKAIEDAQAKLDGSGADKEARDQALVAADASGQALSMAVADRKAVVADAHQALMDAQGNLKNAKAEQKSGDAALLVAEKKKHQLEDGKTQYFVPLKESPKETPNVNKVVKSLEKLVADFGFDSTLVGLLPGVLKKEPDARGTFDNMALAQCEEEFVKQIANFESVISEGDAGKAQREAAVMVAQGAVDAAKEKEQTSAAALEEAKQAQMEGEQTLHAAQGAVKDFLPELQRVQDALDGATTTLASFREGPLAVFAELAERATPPPEPELPVEEPVVAAAEPPAAASMDTA